MAFCTKIKKNYMCKKNLLPDLNNKEDSIQVRETLRIIIFKY